MSKPKEPFSEVMAEILSGVENALIHNPNSVPERERYFIPLKPRKNTRLPFVTKADVARAYSEAARHYARYKPAARRLRRLRLRL